MGPTGPRRVLLSEKANDLLPFLKIHRTRNRLDRLISELSNRI